MGNIIMQHPAVDRIRECVVRDHVDAALLSHREVVAALAKLQNPANTINRAALLKAAAVLGLDPSVLSSVLIEGLSALEWPRDGYHFEVLSDRALAAPATKSKKGGR